MAVAKKEEVKKVITTADGIEFYESVKKTNPQFTKNQNVGGRKITTVDPQYQTENATKAFDGLYGATWGVKDIEFKTRVYKGLMKIGEHADDDVSIYTEIMTLSGIFYYPNGEFPYAVSDKSYYITNNGKQMIDADIEKKLITSFKSKCLSQLGFNADVFMGDFDNPNYVNEVADSFNLITFGQFQEIAKLMQETDTEAEKFNASFSIDKTMELPLSEYNKAIAMLAAKKSKLAKEAKAKEGVEKVEEVKD